MRYGSVIVRNTWWKAFIITSALSLVSFRGKSLPLRLLRTALLDSSPPLSKWHTKNAVIRRIWFSIAVRERSIPPTHFDICLRIWMSSSLFPDRLHQMTMLSERPLLFRKKELYRSDYCSKRDFQQSVERFILKYNTESPHRFNKNQSPVVVENAYWEALAEQV